MPDLLRGFALGQTPTLRNPRHIRPWQHVLDCLKGYLGLVDSMLAGSVDNSAWNFGPLPSGLKTVEEVAQCAAGEWGHGATVLSGESSSTLEAPTLTLDSTKAREVLGWRDTLDFPESVGWTVDWTKRVGAGERARDVTEDQISEFVQAARRPNALT